MLAYLCFSDSMQKDIIPNMGLKLYASMSKEGVEPSILTNLII